MTLAPLSEPWSVRRKSIYSLRLANVVIQSTKERSDKEESVFAGSLLTLDSVSSPTPSNILAHQLLFQSFHSFSTAIHIRYIHIRRSIPDNNHTPWPTLAISHTRSSSRRTSSASSATTSS